MITALQAGSTFASFAGRDDVSSFAQQLATRHGFDPAAVSATLARAQHEAAVIRLITPPTRKGARSWRDYRARFLDHSRINGGIAFWDEYAIDLERAERQFGVPAEVIVAIIGVETIYGRDMGSFRVIDALATLAFDFPDAHPRAAERRAFFQRELEQFLTLMDRTGIDPHTPRGSYAGAMGLGQFMPSSWSRYAVDFDGDGRIDLWRSAQDAIGSVANYFVGHGWQSGMPTHYAVAFDAATLQLDALLAPDILPTFSVASMAAQGAHVQSEGAQHTGPLALVELQNGAEAPSYVAGTENFYAITRYNWSSYYAMAVIELGRAVAAARP